MAASLAPSSVLVSLLAESDVSSPLDAFSDDESPASDEFSAAALWAVEAESLDGAESSVVEASPAEDESPV